MTYTFKLARRLAVSRKFVVLTALALLAACMGDATAPDANPSSTPDSPVSLKVSPRSVTIETNQVIQFRGLTRNLRGDLVAMHVAWGSTGGSITAGGVFSSPVVGTFKVTGRGRGWKHSDSSVVIVVPPPSDVVRLGVTPGSVTLSPGATQAFTVTGYRGDGTTAAVGATWSATGGTVDPAGVYTADSVAGTYRVIATNTAGTLADTATVKITPSWTLTDVVLSPINVSLTSGTAKQFKAYGRTSLGDSVAVAVAFNATGGSITSGGLYTAGQTAGTYRVIATTSGLADTAPVTVTPPATPSPAPTPTVGVGIPYGPFGSWDAMSLRANTGSFTLNMQSVTASNVVARIDAARANKVKLVLAMTGGAHDNYLTNGVFDRSKWNARMDDYNTAAIKTAVASAVADGVIIGNSVMDEPHVSGGGDGNTWGPVGTMTKARVDSLCGYVKAIFPTLPVGVAHQHDKFEPTKSYRVCEFLLDQYSTRLGDVIAWREAGLALGARDHHAILFSMNLLNGGTQDRDGTWDCRDQGGRLGQQAPSCQMTAAQVRDYGLALGPAGCGLLMWRYDDAFMAAADNQRAFSDVGANLATRPSKACRRS
jgi:hypothetical protein